MYISHHRDNSLGLYNMTIRSSLLEFPHEQCKTKKIGHEWALWEWGGWGGMGWGGAGCNNVLSSVTEQKSDVKKKNLGIYINCDKMNQVLFVQ